MMGERTKQALEELDLNLSLDSLEESDSESLTQEAKYQSQLQDRIFNTEELVEDVQPEKRLNDGKQKGLHSDRAKKEVILDGKDTITNTPNRKNERIGHKKISFQKEDSSYCHLRYDPNWKKHQSHGHSMAAYQDQDEFSDDSSSFSDELSIDMFVHQKTADDKNDLGISGISENKLPYRMVNKHKNNEPNDFISRKSESCEELSNANNRVLDNKHRFKSAESNTHTTNKDFIETNKLTLGVRATKTHKSYLNMYTKKKDDTHDKVEQIIDIHSVKTKTEPRNQVADIVDPSRKPKHTLQEHNLSAQKLKQTVLANGMLEDTNIQSHIIKERQFSNLTPSTSMPDLLLNMDVSKLKYTATRHFTSKESPGEFFSATKDNYYDKHFLFSGQVLNDDIIKDNLHLNQWQVQKAQKQNKTHQTNQDRHNIYDVAEMEKIILGAHSSNKSNITLNQNHMELGYTPFNGVQFYDYLATKLQMQADAFTTEEERNQNAHPNPVSDGSQTAMKKTHEMKEKQRKIPKGYVNKEIKLGGIGPSYTISKEKKEQLHNQKEYAKAIQERNRNTTATVPKAPEVQTEKSDRNKGARHKGLDYAKNIPKPQLLPKPTDQKKEETAPQPIVHDHFSSQIKLLEELQMRHEREKVAVAALSALHIL
ncbi:hypothetical protein XENTR_v10018704 [Xenopus tropicalis]|uniref:Jhy protein homolog isoform X1 n=1 Tax=Xenopus tropicalis TaxID=8364 RepID=A0A803KEA0_XENTR|nr:jhy protein homolog isoform X1 [Xenopus tropicalis]KAE8592253.1 hypothetical protein XENTR_v10018704 [Xenopus tropicalis]